MWECGSWHDSVLIGERAYSLNDLAALLPLGEIGKNIKPHRCAQVNNDLYLFVFEPANNTENKEYYCYFTSNFQIQVIKKRDLHDMEG